jgi:hypothetical protein
MKLPFSLGLKFVFRVILPGFVLALGFFPILRTVVDLLKGLLTVEYAFIGAVLVLGWLVVILDMPIYMAFEGRRYWPKPLRALCTVRERRRLRKLERIITEFQTTDRRKYIEASVEIRWFPLDEVGGWEVRYPTRIGNLLTAYEEYSKRIYGMWQGFYWPRIWLTLDKDLREEIDSRQALADSTLYTVFALYVCGVLCLIYAGLYLLDVHKIDNLPLWPYWWILPIACFGLGYLLYRVSLHVHAQFGETFKGLFDLHGPKVLLPVIVEAISALSKDADLKAAPVEEQNLAVWFYLHNFRIKCRRCGTVMLPVESKGHRCSP